MNGEPGPGQAERRLRELRALYALSLVAASLDPEDILRLTGEQISHLFDAAAFFVALVDEEHDSLRFAHCLDRGMRVAPFTVPLSEESALTQYVLQTASPLLIADLAAEQDPLPATPIHMGEAARAWLGVPLVVKGRAIGVMSVQSYTPRAFDEDDSRLLSLAAQQAAAALENARLYQQTAALERRYSALLEALDDGYAIVHDGRVALANARLARILGGDPGELLPPALANLPAPGRETTRCRTQVLRADGAELPVELTLSPIDYDGAAALAVFCRDVSHQVRLEAQLLQVARLSAVGQLVSGVAHELNNPLTTIKGYAQLLQAEPLNASMREDLQKVEEAVDRCRRIVRDLLTFARRYEPECTDTDVNELLQRTVALRSYDLRVHSIAVQWALDPQLPIIQADPHRLQQVILNLVLNAEQAILARPGKEEGGTISIRSGLTADGGVRFEMSNSGPPIRREHMARIFDPFFSTRSGPGLGLPTAYGIVKDHGGRIWAESPPGGGATFVVELPLGPRQEVAADGV